MEHTKCDQVFIACFQKCWTNITKEERDALYNRRSLLNSTFSFTEENLLKLRRLNDILHKKEVEIHAHANRVRGIQRDWLRNNLISDYYIEFKMSLWCSSFDKLHPDLEGNPFYESSINHFGDKDEPANLVFINDNWNEFEFSGHPMANDFHCYTFHCIYDHTCLSWQDIVAIEDVRIEINVSNQFFN